MGEELSERQEQLKEQFIKDRGYWSEGIWEPVLKLDPDFFEAYLNFSAIPWRNGTLPPKIKELIYVAIDASQDSTLLDNLQELTTQLLTEKEQQILEVLASNPECKSSQIAEYLGVPVKEVYWRRYRMKKKMKCLFPDLDLDR